MDTITYTIVDFDSGTRLGTTESSERLHDFWRTFEWNNKKWVVRTWGKPPYMPEHTLYAEELVEES